MAKRAIIVVAFLCFLICGRTRTETVAGGWCGEPPGWPLTCALEDEWCGETSAALCGYYIECCSGVCRGPDGGGDRCNDDSNQCHCVELPR